MARVICSKAEVWQSAQFPLTTMMACSATCPECGGSAYVEETVVSLTELEKILAAVEAGANGCSDPKIRPHCTTTINLVRRFSHEAAHRKDGIGQEGTSCKK